MGCCAASPNPSVHRSSEEGNFRADYCEVGRYGRAIVVDAFSRLRHRSRTRTVFVAMGHQLGFSHAHTFTHAFSIWGGKQHQKLYDTRDPGPGVRLPSLPFGIAWPERKLHRILIVNFGFCERNNELFKAF